MKIGVKLTIAMIVLSVFIMSSVGITLITVSGSHITELEHEKAVSIANEYSAEIQAFFTNPFWSTARVLANICEQYESIDINSRRPILNTMIQGIVEKEKTIAGIWCIWEPNALEGDDQLFLGTDGTNDNGRFAPYWFRETPYGDVEMYALNDFEIPGEEEDCYYTLGKLGGRGSVLAPYLDDVAGKEVLMCSITAGIYNGNRLVGVVGVDFTADVVQEMSQSHVPFGNGRTVVYSNDGLITGHYNEGRLGAYMDDYEHDIAGRYFDDLAGAVEHGKELFFINRVEGQTMYIYVSPIWIETSDTPWSFLIIVPEKTIMAPVIMMRTIAIIICVLILALVIPGSIILARTLAKPIIRVTNALRDISGGEGNLTRSITVHSKNDEVGALSYYFNKMLKKIRELVFNIRTEADILSGIGKDLAANMNDTASAVNEITANIQSIKARVINQSASVSETHATMEQVTSNINKLNAHVEKQSSHVSAASAAIEEMVANVQSVTKTLIANSENVKDLQSASEVGRTGLQNVALDIKEILRESEGLMEINAVIKNISSQTNLLSMNAAIEAAHAGDSGRGFAVVADEIRKLAESSSQQSKTISIVLKKIKESIGKISKSTENVLSRFEDIDSSVKTVSLQEDNIRNAMEEQGEGSKQILEGMSSVNEITKQVRNSSNEMFEYAKEVIRESENLEKATQEITTGINEMAGGAELVDQAVNHVNDISRKNREGIDTLIKEVSRFIID